MEMVMTSFIPDAVEKATRDEVGKGQWATNELAEALLFGRNYKTGAELQSTKHTSAREFCGDMCEVVLGLYELAYHEHLSAAS